MRSLFSRPTFWRKKITPRVLVIFGLLLIPGVAYMVQLTWTLNAVDSGFTSAKMFIVDLDGDTDLDIVGIAQTPDDVAWYENDGSESFTKNTIDSNAPGVRDVQVGDIDNDGDIDILISQVDSTPDGVYWYDNDGSESFTKRTISTANNPIYIELADVNDDDELDVIASLYSDGDIIYYENQGGTPSTFDAGTAIDTDLTNPRDVVAADIDGDDDIDIIGSHSSTTIPWYENDGSETFTERSFATTAASVPLEISIVDVDGDTNLDMLIASSGLGLFTSDGGDNPTFTKTTIDNSASTNHFDTADFDGDGDIDVVAADEGSSKALVWLENDGSETFTNYDIDTDITYAWLIDAGDIDGDGDIDFVAGSNNGVELWINGGEVTATSTSRGWAARQNMRRIIKNMRAGIFVHEDTEAPTLSSVGIFDPEEQEQLRAAAAGTGSVIEEEDSSTEDDSNENAALETEEDRGTEELARIQRLQNRHWKQAVLPAKIVTTGEDTEIEESQEPEEIYESPQHERICERVYRRFSDNPTMIERINTRLDKRYGFVCSEGINS